MTRPAVYEAAIFAAQFFLLAGFFALFHAIKRDWSFWWIAFAGALWAMSVGSRASLLPGIAGAEVVLA